MRKQHKWSDGQCVPFSQLDLHNVLNEMVGHLEIARQQVSALVCTLGLHASCLIIGWGENRSSYFERFKFSFCHNFFFFSFLSGFISSSCCCCCCLWLFRYRNAISPTESIKNSNTYVSTDVSCLSKLAKKNILFLMTEKKNNSKRQWRTQRAGFLFLSLSILSQITSPVCVWLCVSLFFFCLFFFFTWFAWRKTRNWATLYVAYTRGSRASKRPASPASSTHSHTHTHTFHSDMSDAYRLRILWPRRFIFFFFWISLLNK